MWLILLIGISYLIGSIPTSIIAGKLFRGIDIRDFGSRNPGATNTVRVLGKKIGITVGLIDIFKGFFTVFFLTTLVPSDAWTSEEVRKIAAGFATVSGHMWTVFAGFKGGKGVGTSFGVFLGLTPLPTLITFVVWCLLTFGTGYVSLYIYRQIKKPISLFKENRLSNCIKYILQGCVLCMLLIQNLKAQKILYNEENEDVTGFVTPLLSIKCFSMRKNHG